MTEEPPYMPFYKPYGMSDEEFEYLKDLAQEAYDNWEYEQWLKEQENEEKEG